MENQSSSRQVLQLARDTQLIRSRDLRARGIHPESLRRLEQQGMLVRAGLGIYTLPQNDLTEHQSQVEACARVPHGIICLLSALRFHELTTQAPFEVWMAIANKARPPKDDILPLRIVYMSGKAFSEGIEEHYCAGLPVKVYSVAKTVVDCFKYRHKIGMDVALEALRESWYGNRCTIDELWHYAEICRVARVIYPYLESLT
ncbi:type IV toxin-antitoxin system AbiEi family antitoxin domain-containing protein [Laspinema sp. D1]|uniref:Type IV toxin-antitoxin system AbiEi family antitoxin domain-containing protein n=1 Tax=Laspinema palackyanum D2a TaxID=2953684 RepID=A0ABT2MW56_9CYAN|nr:type IV toxin-antitoxin system AbiEi family antitoxin domain-containing protein [Laspinema sp. D2a]